MPTLLSDTAAKTGSSGAHVPPRTLFGRRIGRVMAADGRHGGRKPPLPHNRESEKLVFVKLNIDSALFSWSYCKLNSKVPNVAVKREREGEQREKRELVMQHNNSELKPLAARSPPLGRRRCQSDEGVSRFLDP
ncbi:hypothetical protein EYF80_022474 [Liparis tanakae]|uniref:Uncharacterized protein n=1 Tax=Liparis tanakae TaxID=230148 RepID=A0A4Z2HNL5_9TELE|nr:hypothetical protein EYF80_022474 [Liparis tanakae]